MRRLGEKNGTSDCGFFMWFAFLVVRCGSASEIKLALWSEKGAEIAERRCLPGPEERKEALGDDELIKDQRSK